MNPKRWLSKLPLFFVFLLLGLYFLVLPRHLLFYDAPEYVSLIKNFSFWESLSLGHEPLRPVFMAFAWLGVRAVVYVLGVSYEYAGNMTAFIYFLFSLPFFYLIGKEININKKRLPFVLILTLLFPATFITATGLMVEGIMSFFFVGALYYYLHFMKNPKKRYGFSLITFLVLLTACHIMGAVWSLIVFLVPFALNLKEPKKDFFNRIVIFTVPVIIGIAFLYLLTQSQGVGETGFFVNYYVKQNLSVVGLLRAVRNFTVTFLTGYGVLTVLAIIYLFYRNNFRQNLWHKLIFIFLIFVLGSTWSGDFMAKRIIFISFLMPLLLVHNLGKRPLIFLSLYLIPIFVFNWLLYLKPDHTFPLVEINNQASLLPSGGLFLETHYLRPFINNYRGSYLWVGTRDNSLIDSYLDSGKPVFMDSQAVFAPYLMYVGQNLHVTSLGKFGDSESKFLFNRYTFDLVSIKNLPNRVFAYEVKKNKVSFEDRLKVNLKQVKDDQVIIVGKEKPGTPVLVYKKGYFPLIHRHRVDYGDLVVWGWNLIIKNRKPLFWTYADRDGIFILPIEKSNLNKILIKSQSQKDIQFQIYQ